MTMDEALKHAEDVEKEERAEQQKLGGLASQPTSRAGIRGIAARASVRRKGPLTKSMIAQPRVQADEGGDSINKQVRASRRGLLLRAAAWTPPARSIHPVVGPLVPKENRVVIISTSGRRGPPRGSRAHITSAPWHIKTLIGSVRTRVSFDIPHNPPPQTHTPHTPLSPTLKASAAPVRSTIDIPIQASNLICCLTRSHSAHSLRR